MNIQELPKLYTEREIAAHLGVSLETVARERRRGRLPFTLVAKKIRITAEQLQTYLRSRECTATSTTETARRIGTSTSTTSELDNAAALAHAQQIVQSRKRN